MRNLIPTFQHGNYFKLLIQITCLISVVAINNPAISAQGFGVFKIKGSLQYKEPPLVYVPGDSFIVEVFTQISISQPVLDQLQAGIENILTRNDRRFKKDKSDPDTWISCTIKEVATSSAWENRTRSEYQATGTHTVHNDSTNSDETVTDYSWVNVPYRALVVRGEMKISYEARDTGTNIVLDAGTFPITFSRDFVEGIGVIDDETARQELANNAAAAIASRLVPKKDWISVLLPKGRLKQSSNLFKAGLLNQSLDMLEAIRPFKNLKDDAYRYYSLGLGYEAIAFTSNDLAEIVMYLEKATDNLKKATELKPKEDNFWEPRWRAESFLSRYRKLVEQLNAFEARKKDPSGIPPTRQLPFQAQAVKTAAAVLTNDSVIDLVKSGASEDYIIASVKHAPANQFDLSPSEVARMKQAGVSKRIINAMQDSQRPKAQGISRRRWLATLLSLWPYWVILL